MSYEILYTSAPSGLKPGSSGYCTVQGSRGIPAPAVDLLESLSGYRHVFTPGSPEATHNPVNWGHYLIRVAGRVEHVLSRVGDCELDYTGRSNKLAHHLVVDGPTTATLPGGPAWFLSRPGLMYDQWDGTVSHLGTPRIPPPERRTAGQCAAWGGATGDAGWGGVLAEAFLADPERKVFVVYAPGTNVLALFEEAIALLPEHRRWDVTFATYGAALPKTVDCLWSGLIAGSPEVAQSHRFVNALRIDLTSQPGRAVGGPLVELARTGVATSQRRPTTRPSPTSSSVVPQAEPVYETGYQPVPPPPGILPPVTRHHLDEPQPPSLPPRSRSGRSNTIWRILLALSALLIISVVTVAALLATGKWPRGAVPPELAEVDSKVISRSDQTMPPRVDGSGPAEVTPASRESGSLEKSGGENSNDRTAGESSQGNPNAGMAKDDNGNAPPMTSSKSSPPASTESGAPSSKQTANGVGAASGAAATAPMPASESPTAERDKSRSGGEEQDAPTLPLFLSSERSPQIGKNPDDETTLEVKLPSASAIKEIVGARLFVPRGKGDDKIGGSYHERAGQTFEKAECRIEPYPFPGSPSGTEFIVAPQLNEGKLSLKLQTKMSIPTDAWRTCLSHSILRVDTKPGNQHVFVAFTHPAPPKAFPALKNLTVQFAAKNDITLLTNIINRSDVLLENLRINFQNNQLNSTSKTESLTQWSLEEHTDGFVKSLHLTNNEVVTENGEIRVKLTTIPEPEKLEQAISREERDLELDFDKKIKRHCNVGLTDKTIDNFKHNYRRSDAEHEKACVEVKDGIAAYAENLKKLMPSNTKAVDDELENTLKAVDKYISDTQTWRKHRSIRRALNSDIAITNATLRYKAWRVGLKKEDLSASPAGFDDYVTTDLWKFEPSN